MATTGSSISVIATLQALALVKGPSAGSPGPQSAATLYLLDDKATLAVDQTVDVSEGQVIRFGKVPKGAKIIANLSRLCTNHTATIPGKISLVPLSGAAATDIATVTVALEALAVAASGNSETLSVENGSLLDAADSVSATEESWVVFTPASDVVCATAIKTIWARIVYAMGY